MQYPCAICNKNVINDAIYCNFCENWVHPKCNLLSKSDFLKLSESDDSELWSCYKCNCTLFPMNSPSSDNDEDREPPKNNNSQPELNREQADHLNCKYHDIESFKKLPISTKKSISFFHININSLKLHFDELEDFLNSLEFEFSAIGVSETRITTSSTIIPNTPANYHCYRTDTEANHGGTLLYISNKFTSHQRIDLQNLMYSPKQLESTFAEIERIKQPNIIVGTIYRHHSLSVKDFNKILGTLLENINKQGKLLVLTGDFNINLLNYDTDTNVTNFIDTLSNYLILPHINLPTRITETSKTLIDNIFISPTTQKSTSGNFITGISDHLAQFVVLENLISTYTNSDHHFYKDWKNFNAENFKKDFCSLNWDKVTDNENPSTSFDLFFQELNDLISIHVPTRKLSKKQTLGKQKPWVTKGIKKSIAKRDILLKKFINSKSVQTKSDLHTKYKFYRNNIVNLLKISKSNYFKQYFSDNSKNSKNTWLGINEIINNTNNKNNPNITLNINNKKLSNHSEVANAFNNFFCSIASNLQKKIPVFGDFRDFVTGCPSPDSFFFKDCSPSIKYSIKYI